MGCPNKQHPEYQALIAEYGEGRALAAYTLNGNNIPTVEQARELLPKDADVYLQQSTIQDQIDAIVSGFGLDYKYDNNGTLVGVHKPGTTNQLEWSKKIQKWADDKWYFSSVGVYYSPTFNTINFRDKNTGKMYQLEDIGNNNIKQIKHELQSIVLDGKSTESKGNTIQSALNIIRGVKGASPKGESEGQEIQWYWEEDKRIKSFIASLGGRIQYVPEIVVSGKVVGANAMVDVIKRTIQIADGREKADTLPEEAAHVYVHWLPSDSKLLADMLRDIRTRKEYKQTLSTYGDNPMYQNEDGTVNEHKIAVEAIGKVIAGTIVGKVKDRQAQSWWQRILSWLTGIFKGKDYDAYEVAASDILGGKTGKLDMKAIKEANERGEIYYQMPEGERKFVNSQITNANEIQKATIEKLTNPENRVALHADTHTYTDLQGNEYRSTTSIINGEFGGDSSLYESNRIWGNDMDAMLQGVIQNKRLSEIETISLSPEIREDVYRDMSVFLGQMTSDGSVALTQVVVSTPYDADPDKRTAGSIDLLLIHPDGTLSVIDLKTSWHSIKSTQYNTPYAVGKGSVLVNENGTPMQLNRNTRYSTQVGSYSKMLELAGYRINEQWTKHLHLHTEGDKITEYTDEGIKRHLESASRTLVDKVVPGEWTGKEAVQDPNPLHNDLTPLAEQEKAMETISDAAKEELTKRVQALYQATVSWRDRLDKLRNNVQFKPAAQTIENVDELLTAIELEADTNADYSKAYTVFLQEARKQLSGILQFLTKREDNKLVHADKPEFLWIVSRAAEYIETYNGLYHTDTEFTTPTQKAMYLEVDRLLHQVGQAILAANGYMADKQIYDWSVNEAVKGLIEKSVFNGYGYETGYNIATDIDAMQEMMGSLGGNTVLDITQKEMTDAAESAKEAAEEKEQYINKVANRLVEVQGNDDYSFMIEDGHIVTAIGKEYNRLKEEAERGTYDPITGERIQYIEVDDSINGNKEHIAHNNTLWKAKQKQRKFMEAEKLFVDEEGEIVREDGKYHQYTDEFVKDRAIYMYPVVNRYGIVYWKFRSPKGLSTEITDKLKERHPELSIADAWQRECQYWRNKNYNYTPYMTVVVDKKGEPTGVTKEVSGDGAYFPKSEHVKARLIASDGTHLTDAKYRVLRNPQTPLEEARSAFYEMYTKTMGELMQQLPPDSKWWFEKGNIPSLPANIMTAMSQQGADKMAILMKYLKPTMPKGALQGKDIVAKKGIPLALMNTIQDTTRLKFLNDSMATLVSRKDSMSKESYDKEYNKIKEQIDIESAKMKSADIHPDLTLGLKAFVSMAETFKARSDIEQKLLNLQQKIDTMTFEQKVGMMGAKRIVSGKDSRTAQRFQWFLDNEFYHDNTYTKSVAEYITDRLMNATSASSIAFNITGMINNSIVANLNNSIEALGGDYFGVKQYKNAVKRYHSDYIPGAVKTVGSKEGKYGKKKAGSKYEWLVGHYNMVKHSNNEQTGRVSWLEKFWGYKGYDQGEYMVQSEVGIAILDTVMVKDKNGNELSLYDAYDWDPNTGEGTLKNGIQLDSKEKHNVTHRIWKTNERIHGNYRWKIQLEKYAVGRLALQFHKWVYPNYKQRFEGQRFDESLGGGMDVEGRYTTLWTFIKSINELKSRTEAWNKLTKLQKNNLKKDLADALYISVLMAAGYIVKRLADGLDDDDPYLRKFTNWMQYEADRGVQELSIFVPGWNLVEGMNLIKNPVAVTNSLVKYQRLLTDATKYPFQDEEHREYQRGVFKGQTKLAKDVRDVFPILREMNQFYLFDQQKSLYIP